MSALGDLVRKLIAAGAPPEAVAIAVEAMESREVVAIEGRRAADRARKQRQRSRDVTVSHVTGRDGGGHPVTSASVTEKAPPSLPPSASPMIINSTPPLSPESPPAKTASRAKIRSSIGESAMPNERNIADAQAKGLDRAAITIQWPKFLDYHRSRGNLMADWDAAWRTWLGNISQFQRSNPNGRSGSVSAAIQADIDRNGGDFVVPPKLGPLRPEDYFRESKAPSLLLSSGRGGRS